MKKMFLSLCLMPLIGCATTLRNTDAEFDALKRENAELRQQIAERDAQPPAPPKASRVAPAPVVVPAPAVPVPVVRPEDMVPPAARPNYGPPQNWGWMYVTPRGCHRPFLFPIENKTNYFLKLRLDGQEIRIRGANTAMPFLPPGQTVYVCLSSIGEHTLMGDAYATRFGQLKKVEAFNTPIHSNSSLTVDDAVLNLW